MVNVRVEMPRTSCHLSIFSLGQRGFQLGLVDGMTGDRPVLTDHARCALEHLLSKVSNYFLKFIVDHDGGKSADGAGSTAAGVFSVTFVHGCRRHFT